MKRVACLLILGIALGGCGPIRIADLLPGPTAMPGASGQPVATTVARFVATAPDAGASPVRLELVDPITGIGVHSNTLDMERLGDGRHQSEMRVPAGSLIRYRYLSDVGAETTAVGVPEIGRAHV